MYNPNQMHQMQGQGMRPGQQPMQRPGMPMQQHMQQMYAPGQPGMHPQRTMGMPNQPMSMNMPHGQGGPQQGYQMPMGPSMGMQQHMGMSAPGQPHGMMSQDQTMAMPIGPCGPQGGLHSMQSGQQGMQGGPTMHAPGMPSGMSGSQGMQPPGMQPGQPGMSSGMQGPTGPASMEHSFSPQDAKMIHTPQSQQLLTPQSMQQPLSQQQQQPLSQQPLSQGPSSMQQPMSQSSMQQLMSQQPLSQQPLSQGPGSMQQPMSQQPLSQQPPSNAPHTPATPQQGSQQAPQQTPMSVPPAGSAQPDSSHQPPQSTSLISQQFPLAHTDPMAAARNMILKDLRVSITELNDSVSTLGKHFVAQHESVEKKQNIAPASNANPLSVNPQSVNPLSVNPPGSVKNPMSVNAPGSVDEPKSHDVTGDHPIQPSEQYKMAMSNFLSVCSNIESNLVLILETQRQYKKFELMSEIKTPGDIKEFPPHLQNFVESMNEDKGHIDDTINYISNLIEKVRTCEKRSANPNQPPLITAHVPQIQSGQAEFMAPNISGQSFSGYKTEYMDTDETFHY